MNTAAWLDRTAQYAPTRPALMLGQTCVADYAGFRLRCRKLAGWLRTQGIAPGDRVALFMKNEPDYLIAMFGAWIAGAVIVPINAKLHPAEASWIIKDSGADLCFATPSLTDGVQGCPIFDVADTADGEQIDTHPLAPDALAWLFYTSGTTGRPKGVRITHGMITAASLSYPISVDTVLPDDAAFYAAPMSHGAGLYAAVHVLHAAAHMCPPSRGFDEAELLTLAAHHGSLSMFLAPTMVQRLTRAAKRANDRGTGIRTIVYGGGPMYVSDIQDALDWFGPKFVQIYGQGECPMTISSLSRDDVANRAHPDYDRIIASVGRAQAAVDLAIAGDDGTFLPPDEIGEILVRGLPVMPGYWNNDDASARTLRDGWLWTGDKGALSPDGYLTLKDRSKDVIISGGTNIYPREVEEALLTHSDVLEVSVIGRASPEWGEDVVAFVVTRTAVDPGALDAHCQQHIARFKRPKDYVFVDELPKNNYGKVLKTELRARITAP